MTPRAQAKEAREQAVMAALGLPDFETIAACAARQQKMLANHDEGAFGPFRHLRTCSAGDCSQDPCSAACHYAGRRLRLTLVPQAVELLERHRLPLWTLSIVHPGWQAAVGHLDAIPMAAAKQWLRRRLKTSDCVAIGSFEAVMNVEEAGEKAWAGHFHLVAAAVSKAVLKDALKFKHARLERYAKPVVVEPIEALGRQTAYALKRFAEQRIAYRDRTGRKNRNHRPLDRKMQNEFDSWLADLSETERLILVGCRIHGQMRLRLTAG